MLDTILKDVRYFLKELHYPVYPVYPVYLVDPIGPVPPEVVQVHTPFNKY